MRTFSTIAALSVVSAAVAFGAAPKLAFEVTVSNAAGQASFGVPLRDCHWDDQAGTVTWTATSTLDLVDGSTGAVVSRLAQGTYSCQTVPRGQVSATFELTAGASDTTMRVRMPRYEFLEVGPSLAGARAWVSLSIWDRNASGLVRLVADGPPGDGAFKAFWVANGVPQQFANLIYFMEAQTVPGQSAGQVNANDAVPPTGFQFPGLPANGLWWETSFILTAEDKVVVTGGMGMNQTIQFRTCPGDANANYEIDFDDLTEMLSRFGRCEGQASFDPRLDIIEDGCIGFEDLLVELAQFGQMCD